jgi:two-component system, sensor histidine kinase and response regulator
MKFINEICERLSRIGIDESLSSYKKKRLLVFNRLNLFGVIMSICWFVITTSFQNHDAIFVILNLLPFLISITTIFITYAKKYKFAIYFNTFFIPLALSLASIKVQETSVLLYLIIYSVFPFFYHSKFSKIIFHYLYVVTLYAFSLYLLQSHGLVKQIIFSPLLQVLELLFLFAVLAVVKIQVMSYEQLLKANKEALDFKNKELTKSLILKDQILTVISHDIIVPLIGLKNISEDIINENYSGEELKEVFPLMINEINKTHNLFSNLLGWSKAQQEGKGNISTNLFLNEVVNQVVDQTYTQAENKKVFVENNIEDGITVYANVDNLLVAIRNLLVNAIKFTPSNGVISLSTTTKENFVQLNISDTGIGIEQKLIKKIFGNELYSSKGTGAETGNGLGLKITQELINQNGGMVFCESSVLGVGTTFAIRLPEGKKKAEVAILNVTKSTA